jgi:S1-C subfamily serine protease
MRFVLALLATSLLATTGPTLAPADDEPKSTADIVEESEPSVALVKGTGSMGTGFLAGPNLLVTNAHVIDGEFVSGLEIAFPSAPAGKKGPYPAELLYEDRKRDLAILSVEVDLPPLRVAEGYAFRKGEDITIIGNPGLGGDVVLENAVSRGVLSTKAEIEGQKFYQLGASINPGNSGGPVFDSQGQVIGVVTLKSSKEEALAFSVPVEELRAALDKSAAQPQLVVDRARARHRAVAAVQGLGGGGALYSFGIDLKRIAATPAGGASGDVRSASKLIDTAIAELDKESFPAMTPEVALIKKDPMLSMNVKNGVGRLADNFAKLRSTYQGQPADQGKSKDTLAQVKARHRQLITDLSAELKLDVPGPMMVAFDDHPMPPAAALAGVMPGSPNVARPRPGASGSLRDRMDDRKNAPTRPGAKGPTGSTLKDRMKARRGNN